MCLLPQAACCKPSLLMYRYTIGVGLQLFPLGQQALLNQQGTYRPTDPFECLPSHTRQSFSSHACLTLRWFQERENIGKVPTLSCHPLMRRQGKRSKYRLCMHLGQMVPFIHSTCTRQEVQQAGVSRQCVLCCGSQPAQQSITSHRISCSSRIRPETACWHGLVRVLTFCVRFSVQYFLPYLSYLSSDL